MLTGLDLHWAYRIQV